MKHSLEWRSEVLREIRLGLGPGVLEEIRQEIQDELEAKGKAVSEHSLELRLDSFLAECFMLPEVGEWFKEGEV